MAGFHKVILHPQTVRHHTWTLTVFAKLNFLSDGSPAQLGHETPAGHETY